MTRPALLLLLLALASCGSPAPATPPNGDSSGAETAAGWDDLDADGLVAYVRSAATARIEEIEPDLALDQLDAWIADPSAAPELGDRVSEQLLHIAIADAAAGEHERAAGLVRLVRARARNRNNAYAGNTLLAEATRRGAEGPEAQQAAIEGVFRELPANRFDGAMVVYRLFQNVGQVDARIAQAREQLLSLDSAAAVVFYDSVLREIVGHRDRYAAAMETVATANGGEPERAPYAFSTVDLSAAPDAQPVRVGVWDTGVSATVYADQLFRNDAEEANGEDDDGNGLVDDLHGVVSDPTEGQTGLTFEPGEAVIAEYTPFLQGIMDLRAGLAATEPARRVLELMRGLQDLEALEALGRNLDAIGEWAHGSHVAGILVAGLPQAQVAVFRSAWAGEARLYYHRGPTDEELAAERANVEDIARFINAHRIRVVNASLGFAQDYVEAALRHEGDRYPTEEAVRARAAEVQAHREASWAYVFDQCPETLFLVSAGNSNRDVVEYGDVPSSLARPNLAVVGAVDRFGEWATFTNSNPERVVLFDFGVAVESAIPNGQRIPLSGTSMASPNAANAAAKVLSVAPDLAPAEVLRILVETADPIEAPFYGRIPNEERALAAARAAGGGS